MAAVVLKPCCISELSRWRQQSPTWTWAVTQTLAGFGEILKLSEAPHGDLAQTGTPIFQIHEIERLDRSKIPVLLNSVRETWIVSHRHSMGQFILRTPFFVSVWEDNTEQLTSLLYWLTILLIGLGDGELVWSIMQSLWIFNFYDHQD